MQYLLIDGSFFIFHRVTALILWWKNAHKEEELENPFENEIFVEKFRSTFVSKIKEFIKKLKLTDYKIFVGRDCPRRDIWRMKLNNEYKGTRTKSVDYISSFFKLAYEEKLFEESGAETILSHPNLEADDCIALMTKYIKNNNENDEIFIITSDKDYLQLKSDKVKILNTKLEPVDKKMKCSEECLFIKIITGDASDNIKGIFKRCGEKTAIKYYQDRKLFEEQIKKENVEEKYNINRKLIDFEFIPENLKDEFFEKYNLN